MTPEELLVETMMNATEDITCKTEEAEYILTVAFAVFAKYLPGRTAEIKKEFGDRLSVCLEKYQPENMS